MSFLESFGVTPPSKLRRDFELMYPFPPRDAVERNETAIRDHMAKSATVLHDGVSARVAADPILNALADEMADELRATGRRGRRG